MARKLAKELIASVGQRLFKSEESLEAARVLLTAGSHGKCISSAYYAMFHAAKALLLLEGQDAKTHSGLLNVFGETFITTGEIDKHIAKLFRRLKRLRQKADYTYDYNPPFEEAEQAVIDAERFVEEIKKLAGQKYGVELKVVGS
jgi:uncharacterized protein (UPF0332 family)